MQRDEPGRSFEVGPPSARGCKQEILRGKPFQSCLNRANCEKELLGLGVQHLRALIPISPPALHGLNPSVVHGEGESPQGDHGMVLQPWM